MNTISSPCKLVCSIDRKTGYCYGCGRTSLEISGWVDFSEPDRLEIMADLKARLGTIKRRPRRETRRKKLARRQGAGAGLPLT